MTEFWNSWWAFAFMLAPFVIGFSGMLMILLMAYRNLDMLLRTFPNSEYVLRQKCFGAIAVLLPFYSNEQFGSCSIAPQRTHKTRRPFGKRSSQPVPFHQAAHGHCLVAMLRRYGLASFGSRPAKTHGRLNAAHTSIITPLLVTSQLNLQKLNFRLPIQKCHTRTSMTSKNEISITKYVGLFALLNAILMIFFNSLAHGFDIDLGSGANIAMLIGASMITSNQFVTINKRAPDKAEKNKLILGCLLSSIAMSIAGVAILISVALGPQGLTEITRILPKLSTLTWLVIIGAVTLIHYLMLNLSFGWHANKLASKIQSKA
ncbi:ABZJ_00895 family protein [Stutzerimonas stutzeri]|uniref:ABZJ_00895 family protein n=1 Tax=Stutzerimonas stutzeri TaxID=316 RepID=UPI001C2F02B0|nr:ABZJ_00895 family protein [Stutzerimonas stutzeri]